MRSLLYALTVLSLPMRGAWIEITKDLVKPCFAESLPMRGAWIEMCLALRLSYYWQRRSPCGERGLKFVDPTVPVSRTVAPHAGSVD